MATVVMLRIVSRETDRCCLEQPAATVEVLRIGIAADRTEQLLRKRHAAPNLSVLLNLALEVAVVYLVLAVVHIRRPSLRHMRFYICMIRHQGVYVNIFFALYANLIAYLR